MKRFSIVLMVMLLGIMTYAQRQGGRGGAAAGQAPAPAAPAGGGRGASPEQQARIAAQAAAEAAAPKLQFTEDILPLSIPSHTIGETEGVSMNSKGHLFVYSRTGQGGSARGGTAAELFEFDVAPGYKFVKQWVPDTYGASFAHSVRVDKYDNVWFVDEGSNMVVKMDPTGIVKMTLGRKPEAIDWWERFVERGEKDENRYPVGGMGTFDRPTDVAWDAQDNIYISDGYGNSRFVKIAKDGVWQKAVGTHGSGPDQFSTPHGIAVDGTNVFVADRGNNRIQVYDTNTMAFKASYGSVGAPWSVQATAKYLYSGDGTGKIYRLDKNTGKLLGWIQTGMNLGQTGCIIHEIFAVSDDVLIKGSCSEWLVEKITFKGGATN